MRWVQRIVAVNTAHCCRNHFHKPSTQVHVMNSCRNVRNNYSNSTMNTRQKQTHTHTRLTALFPELPRRAGTRMVKPIWILLKQETMSGSGISWAICKYAPCSRQTTTPAPNHSVFYRPDALPAAQPTASKHWTQETGGKLESQRAGARFTILCLSYDNAKVTIDLRRTTNLLNI